MQREIGFQLFMGRRMAAFKKPDILGGDEYELLHVFSLLKREVQLSFRSIPGGPS
jgi:hypothetical protein